MPSDFSIFDGQETVTYNAGATTVEDVPALRRPLTQSRQRNVERYIELEATDVVFHLDATALSGVTVAAGDSLTDQDSVSYNVLFVEHQSLNRTIAAVVRPVP
jgi:hypothetical protein